MLIQRLVVKENEEYPELFFRGSLILHKGEALSFDTYYNGFCFTKYRRFTDIERVSAVLDFTGTAKVQLCCYDGEEHILCETQSDGGAELSLAIEELPERGILYPKITALTECEFTRGGYYATAIPREINCCIAICTYRREEFLQRNLKLLENADFSFINRVFVIDNGNTIDVQSVSSKLVTVIPNKNYGGSGGFTRGLIEAADGNFTHVILMDDDIELMPETMEQMTTFIALLKEEYKNSWFSAAMLPLDKPNIQYEMGADWSRRCCITPKKSNVNILDRDVLADNLDNDDAEYGAWWTLCMPVSVTENGLPLPLFIKYDDVEYGLRNRKNANVITMNGIAVRHEAFDRKTSFHLDYYNVRNELIVNALYGRRGIIGTLYAIKRLWYETLKELVLYRYDNCRIVFRAVNDFLRGADFFLSTDEEQLNRELMSSVPKLIPLSQTEGWSEELRRDGQLRRNRYSVKSVLTMGGHLIPSFLLNKEPFAAPLSRVAVQDVFGRSELIQYQFGGNSGIVTKRSFAKFIKYFFMCMGVTLKLLCGFGKTRRGLIERKKEITSFDFWRKHLGI